MPANPFRPHQLIGRASELALVCRILANDGDLMLAGVTGSGRRSLIRAAAQQIGAKTLEIDCLRAISSQRLLELIAESILDTFRAPEEIEWIQRWTAPYPLTLEQGPRRSRFVWHNSQKVEQKAERAQEDWELLQALLALPQALAEHLNCRIVFIFQNFPHLRSWDRSNDWESYLRQEIQQQAQVSYVILATVPEAWAESSQVQVLSLLPLERSAIGEWVQTAMLAEDLQFAPDALNLFLDYVQGHLGCAISLARRIWLDCQAQRLQIPRIQAHHVHRSALGLMEDLAGTFESLVLLLPPIQARVLESLALDPTNAPHAREYLRKHQLARGGGLQGALAGLEQKGLIYGAKFNYRVAMPMLALWLKQRLA